MRFDGYVDGKQTLNSDLEPGQKTEHDDENDDGIRVWMCRHALYKGWRFFRDWPDLKIRFGRWWYFIGRSPEIVLAVVWC